MDNFNFVAGGSDLTRGQAAQFLVRISIASVVTYYSVKWILNQLDPTNKNKKKAKGVAMEQLKRLTKDGAFTLNRQHFNDHELMIASHLVVPDDIKVGWNDIAGLDSVIEELRESLVLPVQHKNLFEKSKLWQAPKGVLLHGPPGCGKTLIAKATAKEAGMRFINLDVAILTDKWYGESQKLASAVFSLAAKIQPCIIFIDEIDSFLRIRNTNDHEATAMMKTQFMMLWDGLNTNSDMIVIVMGATNRPQDLDKAIIRRMSAQFHIGLPNESQRLKIFKLIIESEQIDNDVDFNRLAKLTKGFSGSDLHEMCRNASVHRIRKFMRENVLSDLTLTSETGAAPPDVAITMDDLLQSHQKMKKSKIRTGCLHLKNGIQLD